MGGLLRKLLIYICKPIYKLIVYVYKIFYNLANTHILNQDIVQQLSSNIYVLISVVMLFAFSVTILSAIVNPDLLNDKKKGVTAIFKRSIIGLALMVIVPFGFNELYKIQESIMTNSVIEKLVIGVDFSCKETDSDCEIGGNGGQVIAGTLISSVLYPVDDEVKIAANVSESYSMMVAEDIGYIGDVAKNINVTREGDTDESFHLKFDDEDYAFNFDGLLAILVGGATLYILVLFALDIAVRIFKLAFLELTAPISIVGYIAAGDKILSSWFKQLFKTYMDLFIRIAAMAFYLFLISNLSNFTKEFGDNDWTFVFKAFLIVGMLIFAKQVPNLIGDVLGVKLEGKGGIGGRLGEMAVVGKQAQKAWGAVKNPLATAAGIGSAVGGTISHLGAGVSGAWQQGKLKAQEIRDNEGKAAGFRGFVSGAGRAVGSILSTPGSAVRSLKNGVQNKNLSSIVGEWDRDRELHPEGSTFAGRTIDNMRNFVGAKSSADAELARLDKEKVRIDAEIDFNNSIQQMSKTIKDAIKNSIEKSDSKINIGLVTTDKNGKMIAYNGNYNQIQERINAERTAAANLTGQARTDEFARLSKVETELNKSKKDLTDSYLDDVLDNTRPNHNQAMSELGPGTTNTILQQKAEFETRTGTVLKDAEFLNNTNNEAGKALYEGDNSLYSQQARNQEERRERNRTGNLTDYGKKVQDNNAVNAKRNQGNNGTNGNKK